MLNKKFLSIIIILCLIYILRMFYISKYYKSNNYIRHKHSNIDYAHFSKIDKINYFLYPKLLLTSPQKYTLKEGDALFIPKNWWHWVKTTERSFSINFWFKNNIYNKPFKTKYINNINFNNLGDIRVAVWDTIDDKKSYFTTLIDFLKLNRKNEYVITLDDYAIASHNNLLKMSIKNDVKLPNIVKNYKGDYTYNIWITSNYSDTGLHYDDNDGMMCCLSGTKEVILYPPSDTKYLYKFETYDWMNNKAMNFRYNSFNFISYIEGLSSSRLLYETCKENSNILDIITDIVKKNGKNKIVWGCKKKDGELKWEFYQYNLDSNKVIESFDVFNKKPYIGSETYYYYKLNKNTKFRLPFWGYGTYKLNGKEYPESKIFLIDEYNSFNNNYFQFMERLRYSSIAEKFKNTILNKYKCYEICIHNKKEGQIFVQYLGISKENFINFLKECNYDETLITHYKNGNYKINNEITIVYDIETMNIIRSGFYGIL